MKIHPPPREGVLILKDDQLKVGSLIRVDSRIVKVIRRRKLKDGTVKYWVQEVRNEQKLSVV